MFYLISNKRLKINIQRNLSVANKYTSAISALKLHVTDFSNNTNNEIAKP